MYFNIFGYTISIQKTSSFIADEKQQKKNQAALRIFKLRT